jgi:hypothetical protein
MKRNFIHFAQCCKSIEIFVVKMSCACSPDEEERYAQRILIEKYIEKRPLGRPRRI